LQNFLCLIKKIKKCLTLKKNFYLISTSSGGVKHYLGGHKMKKRSFSWKVVAAILSLALILIPVTSSVSFAQGESAAGGAAASGAGGLSTAAVVGIAAAVVAVGVTVAVAANDDDPAPVTTHHATDHHGN
jgi:hypothetical protein